MNCSSFEGNFPFADTLSQPEILQAIASQTILQSIPHTFNSQQELCFTIGFYTAILPFSEFVRKEEKPPREIAAIKRIGIPTCFVISQLLTDESGQAYLLLSRAQAQHKHYTAILSRLKKGDIVPCKVLSTASFGAFCDIGCGINALLPIAAFSISRISTPTDRVYIGEEIYCVISNKDERGRFTLSCRELLGTWEENAANFTAGSITLGIVRSIIPNGIFVELAPNLNGLMDVTPNVTTGQAIRVYINSIKRENMKIKLTLVDANVSVPLYFPLKFLQTEGHLDYWRFSPLECSKKIDSNFSQ